MKLTQQALAEALGVTSASAICEIEKNRSNLTYSQIEKLLNMGATLNEIFGDCFGYAKIDPPPKALAGLEKLLGTNDLLGVKDLLGSIIDEKIKIAFEQQNPDNAKA